jgi:hypothetical protein
MYGFWFEAGEDKLDALCRKVFAEPSGGAVDYRPLGPNVMVSWGRIGKVVPETPPYDRIGSLEEPQVVVWIPVALTEESRGGHDAPAFGMFVPYIWLDNAMSLATGRELFGYPKSWGWPEFPEEGEKPVWNLDVFGLDYGPEGRAARHPLLEVDIGDTIPGDERELDLLDVAREVGHELFDFGDDDDVDFPWLRIIRTGIGDLMERRFAGVFLKQFRSVEDGLAASQQQIVKVRYQVKRMKARPTLTEHTLTVHELDSHPVVEELGLTSQTTRLAYRCEMDFDVGDGAVIWDAARDRR